MTELFEIITNVDTGEVTQRALSAAEIGALTQSDAVAPLTRAQFVVALTKTAPPILTPAEALAALETFPPRFIAALANKPLEYQAAAIETWRETKTVARDAPLFLDLLAFFAAKAGLTPAQAAALGDAIFTSAE